MSKYRLDPVVIKQLENDPDVKAKMRKLGEAVLAEAQDNIRRMDAYVTGTMHDSGFVDQDGAVTRVGFSADYAGYVHEGDGTSRAIGPRPFLGNAAAKQRGVIT